MSIIENIIWYFYSEDKMLLRHPVAIIQSWYKREGYVKSMADLIQKELQSFDSLEKVSSFSDCLQSINDWWNHMIISERYAFR